MKTQFSQDLRVARRNAGFTQKDVAHFLNVHQSAVSALETGQTQPSLDQIIELSIVFGKSFESFFDALMREHRRHLKARLKTLPDLDKQTAHTFNRDGSLARLEAFLENPDDAYGS